MVQASSRGFAGGGVKKPAIDGSVTDFDIVTVGKLKQNLFYNCYFRWIQCCRCS
jgi:hypothetical protein